MAQPDKKVSDHDILAVNVRPAFEASLMFGATEQELETRLGWSRELLEREGVWVSGSSTYLHMEIMHARLDYPHFLLEATRRYQPSHMGLLGLAGKTAPTVGDALLLHQRYQRLTNRSATYGATRTPEHVVLQEDRPDPRPGSCLVSEYTMLIAAHLLRLVTQEPPTLVEMRTRRVVLSSQERRLFEGFLQAPIVCGCSKAELVLDASAWSTLLRAQDVELAAYFQEQLARAMPQALDEPALVHEVRCVIRNRLPYGAPTSLEVASSLGLGQRTLQRRLSDLHFTFARLLDDTRQTLAEVYLRDLKLSLMEITCLLGYSEQTSFFRAFRRWHQTTPASWRQAMAEERG